MQKILILVALLIVPVICAVVSINQKMSGPKYDDKSSYTYKLKNTRTGAFSEPFITSGKSLNKEDDTYATWGVIIGVGLIGSLLWIVFDKNK
jgi:uncharacterized protein YxeA